MKLGQSSEKGFMENRPKKQQEKRGLEFGKACYDLRNKYKDPMASVSQVRHRTVLNPFVRTFLSVGHARPSHIEIRSDISVTGEIQPASCEVILR